MKKAVIILTICALSIMPFAPANGADTVTRERGVKVLERKLIRMKQIKRRARAHQSEFERAWSKFRNNMQELFLSLDSLIKDQENDLCVLGKKQFCEPEPKPNVSQEHTTKVSFNVTVTRYNPVVAQTDASPCWGAFGDVCRAYNEGLNPIAASRDIAVYPLGKHSKITLKSKSLRNECKALERKIYTVMDTLSDCLRKDRNLRTGRCNKPIESQIDIFTPCEDDECLLGIAKARAFGRCDVTLTKL